LVLLVGAFFLVRKRITTAIGRRTFALLLLYPLSLLVHRVFAIAHGNTIASMLTIDMAFSAILSISLSIAVLPRLAWMSVVFLAGAIAISMFPMHATMLFLAGAALGATLLAVFWTRMMIGEKVKETG
jgi:hypothetical protein